MNSIAQRARRLLSIDGNADEQMGKPRQPAKRIGSLTLEQVFELAYSRPIDDGDYAWLTQVGFQAGKGNLGLLRSVIAAFDHQTHPTSLLVRFSEELSKLVDLGPFSLVLDADDVSVSRPIEGSATYEPHVRSFIESVLKPGMTAIDVGANIGFYTMLMASLVGPMGRVLAFEPNTENCRLIMMSLDANGFGNVELFPMALSDTPGAACYAPMIGSNGGLMRDDRETLLHPNCTVVARQRLDDLTKERVDLIKLDVEGGEYRALVGAKTLIETWRPVVVSEFSLEMLARVSAASGGDLLRWMAGFGYNLLLLNRSNGCNEPIEDLERFIEQWGDPLRIEDLAFVPPSPN